MVFAKVFRLGVFSPATKLQALVSTTGSCGDLRPSSASSQRILDVGWNS